MATLMYNMEHPAYHAIDFDPYGVRIASDGRTIYVTTFRASIESWLLRRVCISVKWARRAGFLSVGSILPSGVVSASSSFIAGDPSGPRSAGEFVIPCHPRTSMKQSLDPGAK